MGGLKAWVDPILTESLSQLIAEHHDNLLIVVRFGSTTQFIKYETDVDVLLVFKELPHRRDRNELTIDWEGSVNRKLAELKTMGFQLHLSPMLRSLEEAAHWSKLYLDMVDSAAVLYDPKRVFASILEQMRQWMLTHRAHKTFVHGLPVWSYPHEATGVRFCI